jgi:serine/threonine protein kinase
VESAAWKQLLDIKSHFVVRTYATFMTGDNICVVMELCSGGDLNVHLEMCGSFSSYDARYASQKISP